MEKEKLLSTIENRLQFLITISIFFPVVLYSFFKAFSESDQNSNSVVLKATTLVVSYLITYILFLVLKRYIKEKWLHWFNILIILGIASFIAPILLATSLEQNLTFSEFNEVAVSLSLQTGMSLVVLLFILFSASLGRKFE